MVTIALTHALQEGPLPQHLVSLGATFCVDQCQSDCVGSYCLHQLQLLMSVHFEKKEFRLKGSTLVYAHFCTALYIPFGPKTAWFVAKG